MPGTFTPVTKASYSVHSFGGVWLFCAVCIGYQEEKSKRNRPQNRRHLNLVVLRDEVSGR